MIPKKLLIVEDDNDVAEAIMDSLELADTEILRAKNGAEALEILGQQPISAVLSDLNMPKMNGLELLENIRRGGYITPFVILTAFTDKMNIVNSLRFGCFDFLEKPFDLTKITQILNRALTFGHALLNLSELYEKVLRKSGSNEDVTKILEFQKVMASARYSVGFDKLDINIKL